MMRVIVLVFATLLLANTTLLASGPTFVQVKSATPQTATGSVAVTYTLAQTAGNLNVVVVGWNDTTSTVSMVSDSLGNNYALAIGPTTGTGLRQSIYYAAGIKAGSNTVTVRFNQAAKYVDIRALEYSGLNNANPLDVRAGAAGSATTASSGAATTTSANNRALHWARNRIYLPHHHQPGCRHRRRPDSQHYRKLQRDSAKQLG